jgi:4-amino-4-deoxy-L-arabinose transferase-like glycosyltransferase
MDMPLTGCLTAALVFFLVGYHEEGPDRRLFFYLFYASLGLGVLAKGPVALLLPALSLLGFIALRGRMDEWKQWHPKASWLALAVPLPWYAACTLVNGYTFIKVFFINQNLERFATTIHGHDRPFYFYLPVLLLLTFPWTFLLIPALRRRFGNIEQILLWWAVVPLVFFSFSGSKLPGYILPVVPPIALLCAKELALPASKCFKVAVFIEAGAMAFIGVAFGFFGSTLNVDPHVSGMLIAGITFAVALGLIIIAIWLPPGFLAGFNVIVIAIILLVATNLVFPRFDMSDTMHPWKARFQQIAPEPQTIYMYRPERWAEYGLQYYRRDARELGSPDDLAKATANGKRILCITDDKTLDDLTKVGNVDLQIVDTIGGHTAFWAWQSVRQ